MPKDWTKDKAEIPPNGERQDMTLDKIGFASNRKPQDDKATRIVIQTVIDNGEYEGFRLSAPFMGSGKFETFAKRTGMEERLASTGIFPVQDPTEAIRAINETFGKSHRFSALVKVEEVEDDKQRMAKYDLVAFDTPSGEANLTLQTEPRQFYRDV